MTAPEQRVTLVLLTHDCADRLAPVLERLIAHGVPLIVVDNGSRDRTPQVLAAYDVRRVLRAATSAPRPATTERVWPGRRTSRSANDEWYAEGSLARAAALLDAHPSLGLVNARIVVGEQERLDPISAEMEQSPLPDHDGIPGPVLLGFMAGAVVVRRAAFLEAGGYDARFFIGGEEETLAVPLARLGWQMRYNPAVVVHHHPSGASAPHLRHYGVRNTVVTAWLHRPWRRALSWTWFVARSTRSRWAVVRGLAMAAAAVPWIVRERSVVDPELDRRLAVLEERRRAATTTRRRGSTVAG
ncbi:glycosyltransferase family 2 protein [Luteipulveratus halotolerans]|uniref:glycosyltransferase family 2 protein n=1 Tax=Luteipulveratus halotolerans TaxID=1631356 RepID=UPI0012FB97AF|nr:glycosyltransferase family 2 protein [Luteipulveratus halotolerans]